VSAALPKTYHQLAYFVYGMFDNLANRSRKLQATIKPLPDLSDHAHVFVFLSKHSFRWRRTTCSRWKPTRPCTARRLVPKERRLEIPESAIRQLES